MENYKDDILKTRQGCLGGSDAQMLAQIDKLGTIPPSARKRLAICKGLIEPDNITNKAMLFGDFIEQTVFESLHETNPRLESNPCLVSVKFSRHNVRCIDHVDMVDKNEEKHVLTLYECKATKYNVEDTKNNYKPQLYHHYMLGRELASTWGKDWKVKVFLVHYNTNGLNLDEEFQFDSERLSIVPVRFCGKLYDINHAMDLVSEYLENLTEYYEGDVVSAEYLPEEIKARFSAVAEWVKDIEEKKAQVEEFKTKLYDFFASKGIRKVEVDGCTFTLVEPTTQTTFDSKSYLADFEAMYPRKYKTLRKKYDKTTNKKGYVKINVKGTKD